MARATGQRQSARSSRPISDTRGVSNSAIALDVSTWSVAATCSRPGAVRRLLAPPPGLRLLGEHWSDPWRRSEVEDHRCVMRQARIISEGAALVVRGRRGRSRGTHNFEPPMGRTCVARTGGASRAAPGRASTSCPCVRRTAGARWVMECASDAQPAPRTHPRLDAASGPGHGPGPTPGHAPPVLRAGSRPAASTASRTTARAGRASRPRAPPSAGCAAPPR